MYGAAIEPMPLPEPHCRLMNDDDLEYDNIENAWAGMECTD